MMSIKHLPIHIICRILGYATDEQPKRLSQWKAMLRLVHVCRLWTEILEPAVFQTVYIYIQTDKSIANIFKSNKQSLYYLTNADIVIGRERHWYASRLYIYTDDVLDCFEFCSFIFSALQVVEYRWSSIHIFEAFSVCFKHTQNKINKFSKKSHFFGLHDENYADIFYRCMPNVVSFRLYENVVFSNSEFISKLLNPYIDKLEVLVCSVPLQFYKTYFNEKLAVLDITLDLKAPVVYLPQMHAKPLKHLKLNNLPLRFSWYQFNDENMGNITFPNLQELKLGFAKTSELYLDDYEPSELDLIEYFKLHFPMLKRFSIENSPPRCAVLYSEDCF